LELFEQGRLKGNRAQDGVFIPAYAARGDASTVLAYVYQNNSGANFSHLIELNYRSYMDPDFDFEKERTNIESAYVRANGEALDWESPTGQFLAFAYRNYEAVKNPGIYNMDWWAPYPAQLKETTHQKRWMIEAGLPEFWRENGFPPQCRAVGAGDFTCD